MAAAYLLGFLFVLGLAQGNPLVENGNSPAYVENLRSGSRIVAGWEAEEAQIPHQISLRMVGAAGGVSSCGGSIIHHNWVITAAHCLANRLTFVVRFGSTNLTTPAYIAEATRRYLHPNYIEWGPVQTDDIALLGIDEHIPYGPLVQPCRLQNSIDMNRNYQGVRLTVSGYGLNEDSWNGGTTVEHLRWVFLRGITTAECQGWYGSSIVQDRTICAKYYNNTAQSSCQGDSGGPLTFVDVDGKPTMVGVVSFGSSAGCNSPWPSAYVRPGHYHPWYTEVTGINFDWTYEDLESSSEESTEETSEKSTEETSEESTEKTSEESTEETSEKSTEETSEKSTEETSEKSTEETSEESTEKTSEESTEETSEKSTEETSEKSTEETSEKSTEETSEESTEKTSEESTEETSEKSTEETSEKSTEETSEESTKETSEKSTEETSEESTEETSEKSTEETSEKSTEETSEESTKETSEKSTEETSEESTKETSISSSHKDSKVIVVN